MTRRIVPVVSVIFHSRHVVNPLNSIAALIQPFSSLPAATETFDSTHALQAL
jgi:hypothetical protein